MEYFILTYKTGDIFLEEREKFRKEHLSHATEYFNEGYYNRVAHWKIPQTKRYSFLKPIAKKSLKLL